MVGPPEPGTRTTFRMLHSAMARAQDILKQAENNGTDGVTGGQTVNIPQTQDEARELIDSLFLSTCEQVIDQVMSCSMCGEVSVKDNSPGGKGDEDKDFQ